MVLTYQNSNWNTCFNTESEAELLNLAMFTKIILGQFSETHRQASNVKSKSKTSQKKI